jgi:hypothetical protein
MASISPTPKLQFFDTNGDPLVGGKLYTYAAGTTTPLTTYTDAGGGTTNANPVILNSRGEASVWLSANLYKLKLTTSTDVEVWTVDNIGGADGATLALLAASGGAGRIGFDWEESYEVDTIGSAVQDGPINAMWALSEAQRTAVKNRSGGIDLTSVMANLHSFGKPVFYPSGEWVFTKLTSGIQSGGIIGEGQTQTVLRSTDTSGSNLFTFTGSLGSGIANQLTFRDFQLQGALSGSVPAKSGGAGIGISPASGENSYAAFNNVMIAFLPIGIDFVAASLWKIIGCNFLSYNVAGVQVANTNSADSGDSAIMGCVFNNPYAVGSGIWQKSSGGLKILGNKFLGGERAYTMALEDSTSVLVISGNSMENMAGADIALTQAVAGKAFVNVCITGNEFSVGGIAIATDANAFLTEVNISANQINMGAVGSNPCIALNNVTDFFIGSNIIKGNGGLGSSAVNIANCANGKIGINTYSNLPTPIVVTGSTGVSYELDHQSGSATTANSWTAYGSLWISSITTVTFAQPFLMTPSPADVTLIPGAGNGEIGGIIVAVSKTQLQFAALSVNNTGARTISWQVRGVL